MTTMKIEIDAHQLLDILIDAGIQSNDAKSLVFDILSAQSGVDTRKHKEELQPVQRRQSAPVQSAQPDEDDEAEYEQEPESSKQVRTTRVSYTNQSSNQSKPINFSNFGGNYNGIAPKR